MFNKTFEELNKMGLKARTEFYEAISDSLSNEFTLLPNLTSSILPIFEHKLSELEFVFIPSGEFEMGFSHNEETIAKQIHDPIQANLDEMRPVKKESVGSFLVSRLPVLNQMAKEYITLDDIGKRTPFSPAFVKISEAMKIASTLQCRLLSEKEWEYICRGGTTTLFVWGNDIPYKDLEKWLNWDFSDTSKSIENPFGIYGMFFGEWCSDFWRSSYSEIPQTDSSIYVFRGGGAYFYPWQDEEWVWCMSAMRAPSTDLIDEKAAFRLVYDL